MRVGRVGVRLAAVPVAALAAGMLALAACGSGPDARFAAEAARTADVIERVSAPGSVQAAAQRGQAQLALDLAMEQKAELTLRAPISGTLQLGRASSGGAGATSLPDLSQLPESAQQAVQGLAGGSGGQSAGGPRWRRPPASRPPAG